MKIGIFDSGIGGLTVLKEVKERYKGNEYVYLADNINVPVGEKRKEELEEILDDILNFLRKENVELLISACGTFSSVILQNNIKGVYTVIDAIEESIKDTKKSNILILGTKATIEKGILKNKIMNINKDINIYEEICKEFVEIVENNIQDEKYIIQIVDKYVGKYINRVDTIILGCTHYILLEKYIKQIIGEKVDIIDPAKCLVSSINLPEKRKEENSFKVYFTKENSQFDSMVSNLIKEDLKGNIVKINMEN